MFVDLRNERAFIFGSPLRFLAPDCLETGKPFTFRKVRLRNKQHDRKVVFQSTDQQNKNNTLYN